MDASAQQYVSLLQCLTSDMRALAGQFYAMCLTPHMHVSHLTVNDPVKDCIQDQFSCFLPCNSSIHPRNTSSVHLAGLFIFVSYARSLFSVCESCQEMWSLSSAYRSKAIGELLFCLLGLWWGRGKSCLCASRRHLFPTMDWWESWSSAIPIGLPFSDASLAEN